MLSAYLAIAGLGILFWIPILIRFYRSWAKRSNPISLGICATIILLIWTSAAGVWQVTETVDSEIVLLVSTSLSLIVAIYCHLAFRLAEKLFDDPRKKEEKD
jgi:hypothetical protein